MSFLLRYHLYLMWKKEIKEAIAAVKTETLNSVEKYELQN